MTSRLQDASLPAATAGFVATLVGFTSSIAIVFQAATSLGADDRQLASWMWAMGWGIGLLCLVPSVVLRKPVMIAWSTPGAAVLALAAAGGGFTMAEAVGAFMVSAVLTLVAGLTGWFERLMDKVPMAIAGALLAGVLARFGVDAFAALQTAPLLVGAMLAAWLVGRFAWPRYAVVGVLAAGVAAAAASGALRPTVAAWTPTLPVFTAPELDGQAIASLGLPLFLVTMASQNVPGVAAIRSAGYRLPISALIAMCGAATLLLAPFGAFAFNLAAITAAICMGREAHPDPDRRWFAAATCGAIYCAVGTFGGVVAAGLAAFPKELIAAIAGLALIGTIGTGLAQALERADHRDVAVVTFLVTLSGVQLAGIGAAFWGLVAGVATLFVQQWRRRREPT